MLQAFREPHAASQISQVEEALKTYQSELDKKARDQERLRLVAPMAGTVLPPPAIPRHEDIDEKLPNWSGTPLEPENVGAYLEAGTLFCQVGDPKRLEAVLIVDQTDRSIIHDGQSVDIKLEGFPSTTIHGTIAEIAESELKVTPKRLLTRYGGEVPSKTDPQTGIEKPQSTSYQARVPIDDTAGVITLGVRGQARVYTTWLPLGTRLWRLVAHTFNFKM